MAITIGPKGGPEYPPVPIESDRSDRTPDEVPGQRVASEERPARLVRKLLRAGDEPHMLAAVRRPLESIMNRAGWPAARRAEAINRLVRSELWQGAGELVSGASAALQGAYLAAGGAVRRHPRLTTAVVVVLLAFTYLQISAGVAQAAGSCGQWHEVAQGEWLSKIAADFGTTVDQLLALNPGYAGDPDLIHVGDMVCVQEAVQTVATQVPPPAPAIDPTPVQHVVTPVVQTASSGVPPVDTAGAISNAAMSAAPGVSSLPWKAIAGLGGLLFAGVIAKKAIFHGPFRDRNQARNAALEKAEELFGGSWGHRFDPSDNKFTGKRQITIRGGENGTIQIRDDGDHYNVTCRGSHQNHHFPYDE